MDRNKWNHWANLGSVELSVAVALSLDLDPDELEGRPNYVQVRSVSYQKYSQRLQVATAHVDDGTLPVLQRRNFYDQNDTFVRLTDFRVWGSSLPNPFSFPDEFPKSGEVKPQGSKKGKPIDRREQVSLQCIIGALAYHAKLDLTHPHKAAHAILQMLPYELKLDERTVADHLKAVPKALENRKVHQAQSK